MIFTTFVVTDPKHANYPGYKDAPTSGPDDVKILGNWESKNIQSIEIPQLKKLGTACKKRFDHKAVPQLLGLWKA